MAVRYLPDERVSTAARRRVRPRRTDSPSSRSARSRWRRWRRGPGELLWDVGAGSGSIAIEWCRSGTGCRRWRSNATSNRRARIAANADRRSGCRIEVWVTRRRRFDGVAAPSVIFVGGGLTQPGLLDACCERLPAGGRLVANVVTVESEARLRNGIRGSVASLRRFQHYRGEPVGGVHRAGGPRCRSPSGW